MYLILSISVHIYLVKSSLGVFVKARQNSKRDWARHLKKKKITGLATIHCIILENMLLRSIHSDLLKRKDR